MPIINQHSFIDTARLIERSMRSPGEFYTWEFQGTLTLLKQYSSSPILVWILAHKVEQKLDSMTRKFHITVQFCLV